MSSQINWTKEIVNSLSHIDDETLDRVTAGASVWLDRRWFRMVDSLDLPPLLKGQVDFRYVVIRRDSEPVAICPFIITRSNSLFFHYSLEKFFFTAWKDELVRLNPESARKLRGLSTALNGYRRLLRLMKAGLEGWVLTVSPLTFRGGIAQLPGLEQESDRIFNLVFTTLKEVAQSERLPLCFYGVEGGNSAYRRQLTEAGLQELFLFFESRIDINFKDLDEWLAQFKSEPRRRFKQEMRQAEKLGYRFEALTNFEHLSDTLTRFYEATYSKYGEEHFHHPPVFWTELSRKVAPMMETIVAFRGDEPKGFLNILKKGDQLWAYKAGRPDESEKENPIYFNLVFYEPLKRALELGSKRFWLSAGAFDAKRRRGAHGHPIYSYIWFPKAISRTLLLPYLTYFSKKSYEEQTKIVAAEAPEAGAQQQGD